MNRIAAWTLAALAAADCLWVAVYFGATQLHPGEPVLNLFPFPGLYLLEIAIIGILAPVVVWKASPNWFSSLAVTAGILLAFFILGGFSLGPYLLPALLGQVVLVILSAKEYGTSFIKLTAIFLAAAFGQAGSMLLLIWNANF